MTLFSLFGCLPPVFSARSLQGNAVHPGCGLGPGRIAFPKRRYFSYSFFMFKR